MTVRLAALIAAMSLAWSYPAPAWSHSPPNVAQDDFASSMEAAMSRMDRGMMAPPSGDADRDFAAMMIPHHQGAIEMAEAELRFGHDRVLQRLAEAIIVEQQQEIIVMRQELATLPPAHALAGRSSSNGKEQPQ